MFSAFPKIFAIGTDYISDIFDGEVEITEKVDGSQFSFGKVDGELFMRSKGTQQHIDNPDKMFKQAVDYVVSIQDLLPDNIVFYCEYLNKPKHNVLTYERVPKNNLILFGVCDKTRKFENDYADWEVKLNIDCVPTLFKGKIGSPDELLKLLETDSCLGNTKIEGVVVKNYAKPFLLGGQPIPLMAGKFVSEAFKEVHRKNWKSENTGKGKWVLFVEGFRTDARWLKAIQHLSEKGQIEYEPRDIGKLMKEVKQDIEAEEKENIKKFLWKEFGGEVLRKSTAGFPEWYKEYLLKRSFDDKK